MEYSTFLKALAGYVQALANIVVVKKINHVSLWYWDKVCMIIWRVKENIRDPKKAAEKMKDKKAILKLGRVMQVVRCVWGFFILAMTVAGVEKIIRHNDLSPQEDLSRPGQMIPFVLGIITIIEGAAGACMPSPKTNSMSGNSRQNSTVDSLQDPGLPRKIEQMGNNSAYFDFS